MCTTLGPGSLCPYNSFNATWYVQGEVMGASSGGGSGTNLLFIAWIGIGAVASICFAGLAIRWWKNRKAMQATRLGMTSGATASKYLHSL